MGSRPQGRLCAVPRCAVQAGLVQASWEGDVVRRPLAGDLGAHRLIADRVAAVDG